MKIAGKHISNHIILIVFGLLALATTTCSSATVVQEMVGDLMLTGAAGDVPTTMILIAIEIIVIVGTAIYLFRTRPGKELS